MSRDKALDRARKLLELAKSDNEHEAANAAAKAAEIMIEWQLDEAELAPETTKPEPVTQEAIESYGRRVAWRTSIAQALAESLGGRGYFTFSQTGIPARMFIVGPKSVIDTVKYMHPTICNEVERRNCTSDTICRVAGSSPKVEKEN